MKKIARMEITIVTCEKLPRDKRGPPSYKSKAKRPRGAGLVTRREFRHGINLTKPTADAYRAGYNCMWKHCSAYMTRKRLKKPGEFNPNNVHGGKLWASRKECNMTNLIAGNIIERLYESGKVGLDQLKQVRHSMSYAYYLVEGVQGENFPEVYAQWKTFDLTKLPAVRKPVKPTRIPTPQNLKVAFTTPWTPEHPLSLAQFCTSLICCWHSHVCGLRPNEDIKRAKESVDHDVNPNEGYAWTSLVGGRSKLHLQKRNTRPWKIYEVCCCAGGPSHHTSPPDNLDLDDDGNPRNQQQPVWNTCCPVAAMEFLRFCQGDPIKVYAKWFVSQKTYGRQNVGDVPTAANNWLVDQGIPGPFDRNSGRKSLGRWLDYLRVPYKEAMQIHGDLESVWRNHYQDTLLKSGLKTREQSAHPDDATKALQRFAAWLHQDDQPKPTVKQQLAAILANLD